MTNSKNFISKINKLLKSIDSLHLEVVGVLIILLLLAPILYLEFHDGHGSFIFVTHDQLDETILSYVFSAKYPGASVYEQMMSGIPSFGLKPSSILFIPLYKFFDVYTAFLVQYIIVLITAFYGTYFCVKKLVSSSIASIIAATAFSLLPFHCIYGNVSAGTPLLILCVLCYCENKWPKKILPALGMIYYAFSTNLVLSGWCAIIILGVLWIAYSIRKHKFFFPLFECCFLLGIPYILSNLDLFSELGSDFVGHRVEFGFGTSGVAFSHALKEVLYDGTIYEASSYHKFVYILWVAALVVLIIKKETRKKYLRIFAIASSSILVFSFLYALFSTDMFYKLQHMSTGIISSFNFTRFFYFLPGLWYIAAGISISILLTVFKEKYYILNYLLSFALSIPLLYFLAKNPYGIFYQNINQINNGTSVTGYISMKALYSDELMSSIDKTIGLPKDSYRVVHLGLSPVASLINGFYTIDGYSNNYSLEYKHQFREVIADELELSDYNREYFDNWGSRCYAFYHEWGNAYMISKQNTLTISDLHLNIEKLKEMNCRYIFSAGEIIDCEQYNLLSLGYFTGDSSYWGIWVYQIQ